MDYCTGDIHVARRITSRRKDKPGMIIVQFVRRSAKERWFRTGRMKRLLSRDIVGVGDSRVFLNENLTSFLGKRFQETRLVAKNNVFE